MRLRFALLLFVVLLLPTPLRAQEGMPSPADRQAIAGVISAQIEAFQHDDAAGAFALAAPNIQEMFGTADRFMGMVQHSYPPVYRPRSVTMGQLSVRNGEIVQRVELVGPDGLPASALYTLERGTDGKWRISGCVLTALATESA